MATDSDGLRKLNELYSLPKNCTETNMRASKVPEALFLCTPVVKSLSDEAGLVRIPEGMKAMGVDRQFVLPGGRMVKPYPANTYDMARDGAVEVERIRITEGPNFGSEGWVYTGSLAPLGGPPL